MEEKAGDGWKVTPTGDCPDVCVARCDFRAAPGQPYTCDYAAITGRSRLAACRRLGADSDVRRCPLRKTPLKKARERETTPTIVTRTATERGFRALYNKNMTDRQIAEQMNVSKSSVHRWRKREGLRPRKGGPGWDE
jgi:hypothetical protein